ncbi:hypothetical protein PSBY109024_10570 [Pseudoalteromonas byunsanensis]
MGICEILENRLKDRAVTKTFVTTYNKTITSSEIARTLMIINGSHPDQFKG